MDVSGTRYWTGDWRRLHNKELPAAGRAARRASVRVGGTGRPGPKDAAGCNSGPKLDVATRWRSLRTKRPNI